MSWPLGVCSWSLDRGDLFVALRLAAEIKLPLVQLGLFTEQIIRAADPDGLRTAAAACGVTIHSTFVAFEREDYSSIAAIAATGGYMDDTEYPHRLDMTRRMADINVALGCGALAVHVGTIPPDASGTDYRKLAARTHEVGALLDQRGLELWIESGREPADVLIGFVKQLSLPNVRINLDPGNFVVYGTGDPPQLIAALMPLLSGVHMKDGLKSAKPGLEFGKPAPLGVGDAQIPRVLSKLRALGYGGPLFLEMSGRDDHRAALAGAADYLRSLM